MAGIGFELRKLFREEGLLNNVKAYTYSSMTTIGPMILCMVLIIVLQRLMAVNDGTYLEWELYIATMQYNFVFSILITSGLAMLLTRFVSDMIFQKKFEHLLSSYYGSLILCLPAGALVSWLFLRGVTAGLGYKFAAYLLFMELIVIWMQAVYLSALKDYMRIVRSFSIGVAVSVAAGWILLRYVPIDATTGALLAMDIGFLTILLMSNRHFEQVFPRRDSRLLFSFMTYFKKYPSLFFIGSLLYAGIYVHSFVFWLSDKGVVIADQFRFAPSYDLPVFYAFLSVIPTLVTFIVSVETEFYERFQTYYKHVLEGGTYVQIDAAKKDMQRTLMQEISFLMEVQLIFTIVSIAIGMQLLPRMGFTMSQIDSFNILVLAYYLFIIMFVILLLLMYFDDRKGVVTISFMFVLMNILFTYWTLQDEYDGLGMFYASIIGLVVVLIRLMYVLRNIDYFTFCSQPMSSHRKPMNGRRRFGKSWVMFSVMMSLVIVLSGCTSSAGSPEQTTGQEKQAAVEPTAQGTAPIEEDKRIYEKDQDDSVKTLYITVLPPKGENKKGLDWYGLNRNTDRYSEEKMNVIMQEGPADGSGPKSGMFGYGQDQANASISLRGNTARYASQKSYKIRLNDEAGVWQNQRTINLNKHSADLSRVRNKLSFDLFETIPNFTSLRTQFVHLYVKDLSAKGGSSTYRDYGLYTQIEQPNEMFLKSHWLDPYGQLYKVAFFEFYRYPDKIKMQSDPTYNKKEFETILEIKGREDHEKLIEMLDDVNNMTIPIDEVMEKHFDLDNYLTWLAVNILTDNMDTDANNFYLYSPLNSDKWYFLPWDYDGGWGLQRDIKSISPYQSGLSNYWGGVLHNRYFRSTEHVQQLKDKIDEIAKNYINKDRVEQQLAKYQDKVEPFIRRAPDLNFLPGKAADFKKDFTNMANIPEMGYQLFLKDLEKPRPFYMDPVDEEHEKLKFSWGISFDLQGDDLTYDWTVALDPAFTQIVDQKKGLTLNSITINELKPNTYYWKVVAKDSKGNTQISFDRYEDEEGEPYYGVMKFEVD